MGECQETDCKEPATKVWNGRKVCADHYDKYREEEEKMRWDLGY